MPTLRVPVLNNRSPDTPTVPALLVDTTTIPELVAVPMPDGIVMEPSEAALPSPPSIVTVPPLVLPIPEARVKLPPMLVDVDPETTDPTPLAAPDELLAVTLNAPPMLVPEPTKIAMLPPEPDTDEPLPISKAPLSHTLTVQVLNNRSPNMTNVPALLVNTATLP